MSLSSWVQGRQSSHYWQFHSSQPRQSKITWRVDRDLKLNGLVIWNVNKLIPVSHRRRILAWPTRSLNRRNSPNLVFPLLHNILLWRLFALGTRPYAFETLPCVLRFSHVHLKLHFRSWNGMWTKKVWLGLRLSHLLPKCRYDLYVQMHYLYNVHMTNWTHYLYR